MRGSKVYNIQSPSVAVTGGEVEQMLSRVFLVTVASGEPVADIYRMFNVPVYSWKLQVLLSGPAMPLASLMIYVLV